MKRLLFILVIQLIFFSANATDLEFKYLGSSYEMSFDKNKILFKDEIAVREIELQKCNRKIVNQYWSDLLAPLKKIKNRKYAKAKKGALLNLNGVKYSLFTFDYAFKKLMSNKKSFDGLYFESKRLCKKKKS